MRAILLLLFVLSGAGVSAQQKIAYYDWQWKPSDAADARFFSVVERSDSLWQRNDYYVREERQQMQGFYKDQACTVKHGPFKYFHTNGLSSSLGSYGNNKKQGLWLEYHSNGMMSDSTVYDNGMPVGKSLGWFSNGSMSDSSIYNPDGTATKVSWFDNGQPSAAGIERNGKQHGKWRYFTKDGQLSAEEIYDKGKLLSRGYFNEDGSIIADTANRDREAVCTKDWQKYLYRNLYFPPDIKIVNSDQATVVVSFVIDEDGKISEAFVYSSFHELIDNVALRVIKNGPRWIPAIDHNRKVKAYRRQPLTFSQSN